MAVYYKFKSAKDYFSLPVDGHFISVTQLKQLIFNNNHLATGTDFDLKVSNAQTHQEYADEAMLIPKNTSVLVRRVPAPPRMPIVTEPKGMKVNTQDSEQAKASYPVSDSSDKRFPEENDWDDFGEDLYAIPVVLPVQPGNPVQDAPPPDKDDEDSKIKSFVDASALDWKKQIQESSGFGSGFGRGFGVRMIGGHGLGRGMLERKMPPPGYICHRCNVPGHLIQHCPTNGDPNYDIKRMKPPTGIPKAMLGAAANGSYALPSGVVTVLKPNEASFEKEMEGISSTTRSSSSIPPDLLCPLCSEVMKDAVLTSKCCLKSFCDKCIRNHTISKLMCICGARNILADDLLPNLTLRATINRLMESTNSYTENAGSILVEDVESAEPKVSPPTLPSSKVDRMSPSCNNESIDVKETAAEVKDVSDALQHPQKSLEKASSAKTADGSEATVKGLTSLDGAPLVNGGLQQNPSATEPVKKKKKKVCLPNSGDLQWGGPQDISAANYMMSFAPSACNPYWGGMQLGMNEFMYPYAGTMPYGGTMPWLPQDPSGGQGYMMPVPPHGNLLDYGMPINQAHPVKNGEEFEAPKADFRRKPDTERLERDTSKNREFSREVDNSRDISSMKSKDKLMLEQPSSDCHHYHRHHQNEGKISPGRYHHRDHHHHHRRDERETSPDHSRGRHHYQAERETSLERPLCEVDRRRRSYHHQSSHEVVPVRPTERRSGRAETITVRKASDDSEREKRQKASVSSQVSTPHDRSVKKRNISSQMSSDHHHKEPSSNGQHEEIKSAPAKKRKNGNATLDDQYLSDDDDDRHFKRRQSWYDSGSSRENGGTRTSTDTRRMPSRQVHCF